MAHERHQRAQRFQWMEPKVSTSCDLTHRPYIIAELVEFLVREANYMASLTSRCLKVVGILPLESTVDSAIALPAELLLELAAILRIGMWERQDLRRLIATDLPPAEEAFHDLMSRAAERPESFSTGMLVNSSLHRRVMHVLLRQFAWNGPRHLGAEVLLGRPEESDSDAILDAVAEFLWARRRRVGEGTGDERESHHGQ